MKKFDYNKLYQKHFKNLPTFVFWASFVIFVAGAITGAIFIFLGDVAFLGVLVILAGVPVAYVLAYIMAWFFAVLISQRIVVADSLINISSGSTTSQKSAIADDDLPEL